MSQEQLMQLMKQIQQSQGGGGGGGGLGEALFGGSGGAAGSQIGGASGVGATSGATGGGMSIGTGGGMSMAGSSGTPAAAAPGMGAVAGPAALAAIAAIAANNAYESGGKKIIKGQGKTSDYVDLALSANPVTGGFMFAGKKLGMKMPGQALFGRSLTTKEQQHRNWDKVSSKTTGQTQDYAQQYKKYIDSDQAKKDAVEGNFDTLKKNGTLGYKNTWGAKGIFDEMGDDYLGKSSAEQRQAMNEKAIQEDLFQSSHGDLELKDAKRFRQIFDETIGGGGSLMQVPSRNNGPAPIPADLDGIIAQGRANGTLQNASGPGNKSMGNTNFMAPSLPPRSRTDSPGMKNGKRVNNYGGR